MGVLRLVSKGIARNLNMRQMRRGGNSVIVFLALISCAIAAGSGVFGAEKQKEYYLRNSQIVMPETHELAGKVYYLESGTNPATRTPVRVWSFEKGKFTQETETDDKGAYKLKPMEPGNYVVTFADHVRVDVRVVSGKKPVMEFLHITIPHGKSSISREQMAKDFAAEGKPSYKE